MLRKKTKRQQKFFEELAKGETPHKAAKLAGYKAPGASAAENIGNYKGYWQEVLDKAGATDEVIAQTIFEGLKAIRVVGYLENRTKPEEGKPEPEKKVSNDFVEVADYQSRAKFTDIALKLKNAYPATKHELAGKDGGPITFIDFVKKAGTQ